MASKAKQRWIVGILIVSTLAVLGMAVPLAKNFTKAHVYDYRIRHDIRRHASMWALGHMKHPAAVPLLERYVREPLYKGQAEEAGRHLYYRYPESRFTRATREYEQFLGRAYYFRFYPSSLDYEKPIPAEEVLRLREWVANYRGHPGTDDALFRIARGIGSEQPLEGLRILHEAFHSPDHDKQELVGNWFQRTLERAATVEDLEEWLETDCPEHLLDNVHYVVGLKHMRRHRFEEALHHFEMSRAARREDGPEMPGWWAGRSHRGWRRPEKRLDLYTDIDEQIKACSWLLEKAVELASTRDAEKRGALLHEMGRRCFRRKRDFQNRMYYPVLYRERNGERIGARYWERKPPFSAEDVSLGNNYRQAIEYFRQLLRESPGYSRIEAVEYSIPLCLWRVRKSWPKSASLRFDWAMYQGFQDFANKYAESTLADEALYLAGIHHWLVTNDKNVIFANMNQITVEYADGNVVREYARQINTWVYGNATNPARVRESWIHDGEPAPETLLAPETPPEMPEADLVTLGLSDGSESDLANIVEVEPADALESEAEPTPETVDPEL